MGVLSQKAFWINQDEQGDHGPGQWPLTVHSVESGPERTLTNPWIVQSGPQ